MSELREHELQLDRAPSRVKRVYVALGCFGVLEFWGFGVRRKDVTRRVFMVLMSIGFETEDI